MSPRFPVPPQAKLARWAIRYGPVLAPYARKLYEHGRWRQLAILHARTVEDGSFSWEMFEGERVWVVWSIDEVLATYPHRQSLVDSGGSLLPGAKPTRRQHPDDVMVQRVRRRLSDLVDRARSDEDDAD